MRHDRETCEWFRDVGCAAMPGGAKFGVQASASLRRAGCLASAANRFMRLRALPPLSHFGKDNTVETPVDLQRTKPRWRLGQSMVTRIADLEQRCGFTTTWRVVGLKELGGQHRKAFTGDVRLALPTGQEIKLARTAQQERGPARSLCRSGRRTGTRRSLPIQSWRCGPSALCRREGACSRGP